MLLEQTKEQLRTLKLTGFLGALEKQLERLQSHELAFENRLGFLVERKVLYKQLRISHGDGSYTRHMMQLLKTDLLIDGWELQPPEVAQRLDLMDLTEDRHGRRSTLIASQLPVPSFWT